MKRFFLFSISLLLLSAGITANNNIGNIHGTVRSSDGKPIEFVTVYVKNSSLSTLTNELGEYKLDLPINNRCQIVFSHVNYEHTELAVELKNRDMSKDIVLKDNSKQLAEVVVNGKSAVQQVRETPFNVVALDAKLQYNSTSNLSNLLNKASGVRIRETGGVGSDMQLMVDGFSGRHIKVFIDGVPQEGVGSSFGLNNIPVNFAERIEIYKGVVPVGFGTDAIGGVINIITKKNADHWNLDASYSYGSFNTHKSSVNFAQTFKSGLTYDFTIFQNYSDNNYKIDTSIKEFLPDGGSSTNSKKTETVERFNDMYHNEAFIAKVGLVNKKWVDRLMFGITYSQQYKEIQNGVRQEIVFGGKYREGYSVMPSVSYQKKNVFTKGLDLVLTANYNKNILNNVDTSNFEFNWRGDKRPRVNPGEQSYQHIRSNDNNWNGTVTANYHLGNMHLFTFNHVINSFYRFNQSLLTDEVVDDLIAKETVKNISGLSYRFMPNDNLNVSVFGKHYSQFVAGPVATTSLMDKFERKTKQVNSSGYGLVGTYFILKNLQSKISYEKVYRLPTNDEMFGDEDLETGDIMLKPESSDNINLNLSFIQSFGKHSLYAEGGLVYRDIKDYIRRNITGIGGGKFGGTYVNHGRVLTKGYNISARYDYSNWLSLGGNFTEMSARDNVKTFITGSPNLTYGARMPNIPYLFANVDFNVKWHNFACKNNVLTFSYDMFYVDAFPLYSEALGSESKYVVPTQLSHDISLSYAIKRGKYNLSAQCLNATNAKLYDNFSLQKPGRSFHVKLRISLAK